MKAVLIIFNQALTASIDHMLDQLQIRGFTKWEDVQGRGTTAGLPRYGTHTWPEMNSSILTIVEEEKVKGLLQAIRKLNGINEEVGIRAFVWNIEEGV